jgi:uncharacterized protein (TIGR00730 family)
VILPGGFGTLDELFEALTLIQTDKVREFPVVMFDSAYWDGLVDWLRGQVLAKGMISDADARILTVTDDPEIVVRILVESHGRGATGATLQP